MRPWVPAARAPSPAWRIARCGPGAPLLPTGPTAGAARRGPTRKWRTNDPVKPSMWPTLRPSRRTASPGTARLASERRSSPAYLCRPPADPGARASQPRKVNTRTRPAGTRSNGRQTGARRHGCRRAFRRCVRTAAADRLAGLSLDQRVLGGLYVGRTSQVNAIPLPRGPTAERAREGVADAPGRHPRDQCCAAPPRRRLPGREPAPGLEQARRRAQGRLVRLGLAGCRPRRATACPRSRPDCIRERTLPGSGPA